MGNNGRRGHPASASWDSNRATQPTKWASKMHGHGSAGDQPLVNSRLRNPLDQPQLHRGPGFGLGPGLYDPNQGLAQSGPLHFNSTLGASGQLQPLGGPNAPQPGPRPGTSPAHLALQSQVETALQELGGLDDSVFAPPPTADPEKQRATTASSESDVVKRLRQQLSDTDAVVKTLHTRTQQLEGQIEDLKATVAGQQQIIARYKQQQLLPPPPSGDENSALGASSSSGSNPSQLSSALFEKERFIEELQAQLVATVEQHETQVNATGASTAAELARLRGELAEAKAQNQQLMATAGGNGGVRGEDGGGSSDGKELPTIGTLRGRELAMAYYAKYREMSAQFDGLLRRRGGEVSGGGAEELRKQLERRQRDVAAEVELEGGLLRAELGELEERLCEAHVASRRAGREAQSLREDMSKRDKLDVLIREMVEKLTNRVQELELENKRLRSGDGVGGR